MTRHQKQWFLALLLSLLLVFELSATGFDESWVRELYQTEEHLSDITLKEWLQQGETIHFAVVETMIESENRILEERQYPDSEFHEENPVIRTWSYSESGFTAVPVGTYRTEDRLSAHGVSNLTADTGETIAAPFDGFTCPEIGDTILIFGDTMDGLYSHNSHGAQYPLRSVPMLLQASGRVTCLLEAYILTPGEGLL